MLDLRQCALGIEFGSTRIKAVLVDGSHAPVAQGDFTWENQLKDGVWTYPLEAVHTGLRRAGRRCAGKIRAAPYNGGLHRDLCNDARLSGL